MLIKVRKIDFFVLNMQVNKRARITLLTTYLKHYKIYGKSVLDKKGVDQFPV